MPVGMVGFIFQLVLAFRQTIKSTLKGDSHLFLPGVERDEKLVLLSGQSDSGLQVALPLVVCDYYFTVLLREEPLPYCHSKEVQA